MSRVAAIKKKLKEIGSKEKPLEFAKDVGRGLVEQFNPDTGSTMGDVAEFAKRVLKGGAAAATYPLSAPGALMGRLGKGAMKNASDLQSSYALGRDVETDSEGTQDEEFDALRSKYGPITGSAIGVAKGTLEGAVGAQGGRMVGQAYTAAQKSGVGADQAGFARLGKKKAPERDYFVADEETALKMDKWLTSTEEGRAAAKAAEKANGDYTKISKISDKYGIRNDDAAREFSNRYTDVGKDLKGMNDAAAAGKSSYGNTRIINGDKPGSFSDLADEVKKQRPFAKDAGKRSIEENLDGLDGGQWRFSDGDVPLTEAQKLVGSRIYNPDGTLKPGIPGKDFSRRAMPGGKFDTSMQDVAEGIKKTLKKGKK